MEYASSIKSGEKIANLEIKQMIDRFYADLENPEYEMALGKPTPQRSNEIIWT